MKEFLVLITVQCRWAEGRGTLSQQTMGTPDSFHLVALPSPRTSKAFTARAQEKREEGRSYGGVSVGQVWKWGISVPLHSLASSQSHSSPNSKGLWVLRRKGDRNW